MENQLYQKLLAEVGDEKLLWHGTPGRGVRLRSEDRLAIPTSLFWGGGAIFGFCIQLASPRGVNPFYITTFGAMVLIGLYLIFGRFLYDSWRRDHIYYGLTDRRALIVRGRKGNRINSIDLTKVPEINLKTRKNGSGTILFVPKGPVSEWAKVKASWGGGYETPAFEAISDARTVYSLIVGAQRTNTKEE
jgi:hypothetical protein